MHKKRHHLLYDLQLYITFDPREGFSFFHQMTANTLFFNIAARFFKKGKMMYWRRSHKT